MALLSPLQPPYFYQEELTKIDLNTEKLLTLNQLAALLPLVDGKRQHVTSVRRWCLKGVGPERIKLEHVRVGRRILTAKEALHRFMQATADAATRQHEVSRAPAVRKIRPRTNKATAARYRRGKEAPKGKGSHQVKTGSRVLIPYYPFASRTRQIFLT